MTMITLQIKKKTKSFSVCDEKEKYFHNVAPFT